MKTTVEYKDFVLEQLSVLDNIRCRPMMGEYLLYYNDVLFGGIYNNRLLVKICDNNKIYNLKEEIPYNGAKPMYHITDLENTELLKKVVLDTFEHFKKSLRKVNSIKLDFCVNLWYNLF